MFSTVKLNLLFFSIVLSFSLSMMAINAIVVSPSLYYTQNPTIEDIETNFFSLSFETNKTCAAVFEYGLTTDYEMGKIMPKGSSTSHTIVVNGLAPGHIYYVKIYGVGTANDTTTIFKGVYCTASESSGVMNVTFVKPLFLNTPNTVVDSFICYINKATQTLDIALCDLTNHASQSDSINYRIIEAINRRYEAGVKVRFITDDAMNNVPLNSLDEDIPVLAGNKCGMMHNTFLLIDRELVSNAWVLSGSTNWSYNNLMMDFNNLIAIQDESLAKAYTLEFDEMWGGSSLQPNLTRSVFGKDKTDNTPHVFNIAGRRVELYFSPSDVTLDHITAVLDSAKVSIDFAMMSFAENSLANAVVDAHKRGIMTSGVVDYVDQMGNEYDDLKRQGVDVVNFANADKSVWPDGAICHHKFCVVDADSNNPVTITGTYNWTVSANSLHDENTLIIYSPELSDKYKQELELIRSYSENAAADKKVEFPKSLLTVAPNPSCGSFEISNYGVGFNHIKVLNSSGKVIKDAKLDNDSSHIKVDNKGLYMILLSGKNDFAVKKVLVR